MNYFSTQQLETFTVIDEIHIFNNDSIVTQINTADKIVMHRWLFHFIHQDQKSFSHLSIHLSDKIVYDKYKNRFIHSLLIEPTKKTLLDTPYGLHRLLLLNNNRICMIRKETDHFKIDIYVFLQGDASFENEETLQWLKYKIAYENAPVLFENEIDYFDIVK